MTVPSHGASLSTAGSHSRLQRTTTGQDVVRRNATAWLKLWHFLVQTRTTPAAMAMHVQSAQRSSWAVSSRCVVAALLANSQHGGDAADPIVWLYIRILLDRRVVRVEDVLWAVYRRSFHRDRPQGETEGLGQKGWLVSKPLETTLLVGLAELVGSAGSTGAGNGGWQPAVAEMAGVVEVLRRWLGEIIIITGREGGLRLDHDSEFVDAVGAVVTAVVPWISMVEKHLPEGLVRGLAEVATSFCVLWASGSAAPVGQLRDVLMAHLEEYIPSMAIDSIGHGAGLSASDIPDVPLTRAGMLIFLSSLTADEPQTCEAVGRFLRARCSDGPTIATALVTGGLDLLTVALYRKDGSDAVVCARSVVVNVVPSVLASLVTAGVPVSAVAAAVSAGLAVADHRLFPPQTDSLFGVTGIEQTAADIRQDFLAACALHAITGPGGALKSADLAVAAVGRADSVQELVDRLEAVDGNGGAVAAAIIQVIRTAATSRDDAVLRAAAAAISRKPLFLDLICQFVVIPELIGPFSEYLDRLGCDDGDDGRQPVYEQFAGVFVAIQAISVRFALDCSTAGVSPLSFVGRYLLKRATGAAGSSFSAQTQQRISSWVDGLSETAGATVDSAMKGCVPHQFFLLVPEITRGLATAVRSGRVSRDGLRTALDYLSEPFLLPAAADALVWICEHDVAADGDDIAVTLIGRLLSKPNARSGDTQAMHRIVTSVAAAAVANWTGTRITQTATTGQTGSLASDLRRIQVAASTVVPFDRSALAAAERARWSSRIDGPCAVLEDAIVALTAWSAVGMTGLDRVATVFSPRLIGEVVKTVGPVRAGAVLVRADADLFVSVVLSEPVDPVEPADPTERPEWDRQSKPDDETDDVAVSKMAVASPARQTVRAAIRSSGLTTVLAVLDRLEMRMWANPVGFDFSDRFNMEYLPDPVLNLSLEPGSADVPLSEMAFPDTAEMAALSQIPNLNFNFGLALNGPTVAEAGFGMDPASGINVGVEMGIPGTEMTDIIAAVQQDLEAAVTDVEMSDIGMSIHDPSISHSLDLLSATSGTSDIGATLDLLLPGTNGLVDQIGSLALPTDLAIESLDVASLDESTVFLPASVGSDVVGITPIFASTTTLNLASVVDIDITTGPVLDEFNISAPTKPVGLTESNPAVSIDGAETSEPGVDVTMDVDIDIAIDTAIDSAVTTAMINSKTKSPTIKPDQSPTIKPIQSPISKQTQSPNLDSTVPDQSSNTPPTNLESQHNLQSVPSFNSDPTPIMTDSKVPDGSEDIDLSLSQPVGIGDGGSGIGTATSGDPLSTLNLDLDINSVDFLELGQFGME